MVEKAYSSEPLLIVYDSNVNMFKIYSKLLEKLQEGKQWLNNKYDFEHWTSAEIHKTDKKKI